MSFGMPKTFLGLSQEYTRNKGEKQYFCRRVQKLSQDCARKMERKSDPKCSPNAPEMLPKWSKIDGNRVPGPPGAQKLQIRSQNRGQIVFLTDFMMI